MTPEKSWSLSVWFQYSVWDWAGSFDCWTHMMDNTHTDLRISTRIPDWPCMTKVLDVLLSVQSHSSSWEVRWVVGLVVRTVHRQAGEVRPLRADFHTLLRNCSFGLSARTVWLVASKTAVMQRLAFAIVTSRFPSWVWGSHLQVAERALHLRGYFCWYWLVITCLDLPINKGPTVAAVYWLLSNIF